MPEWRPSREDVSSEFCHAAEMALKVSSASAMPRLRAKTKPAGAATAEAPPDQKATPKKRPGGANGASPRVADRPKERARSIAEPPKATPKISQGMAEALLPTAAIKAVEEIKLVSERSGLSPLKKSPTHSVDEHPAEEDEDGKAEPVCESSEVLLHVYDLHRLSKITRLSVFHVGVEVYQIEFFFSIHGCRWCEPTMAEGHVHKKVVPLGRTRLGFAQIQSLFLAMQEDWPEGSYNLFTKNCQTFAINFVKRLKIGGGIPSEYVRYARWGTANQRSASKNEEVAGEPKYFLMPRRPASK